MIAWKVTHHEVCFEKFNLEFLNWKRKQSLKTRNASDGSKKHAQQTAFTKVLGQVEEYIVQKKEILRLPDLRHTYVKSLEEQGLMRIIEMKI